MSSYPSGGVGKYDNKHTKGISSATQICLSKQHMHIVFHKKTVDKKV